MGTAGTGPLPRDEAKVDLGKRVGVAIDKVTTLHVRWKASDPNAGAAIASARTGTP